MKRLIILLLMLAVAGSSTEAYSQGWLKSLGKKAGNAAKQAIERNVERTVDKTVDSAFEKGEEAVTGNTDKTAKDTEAMQQAAMQQAAAQQAAMQQQQAASQAAMQQQAAPVKESPELAYAKSDFVAGDEIIFEDTFDNEQLGEFPSQWDLIDGVAEVASVGGKKAILVEKWGTRVCPLMKEPYNYLGDVFTVEFDYFFLDDNKSATSLIYFIKADSKNEGEYMMHYSWYGSDRGDIGWRWKSSRGEDQGGDYELSLPANEWHHIAMSFNKRAWKVYVNGTRIVNVPNVAAPPGWLYLNTANGDNPVYFTNFRIAKGAVPLYDRMMSDGKFITYGITFDVGKSTIKPESMGEINRIVQLMNENPTLKFSVEGHTDSTGNAANNQTLSESRSKAIVAKLVELGISADRLTAVGKGQNNPIADNGTDEGRAKNRRVEFVKL